MDFFHKSIFYRLKTKIKSHFLTKDRKFDIKNINKDEVRKFVNEECVDEFYNTIFINMPKEKNVDKKTK